MSNPLPEPHDPAPTGDSEVTASAVLSCAPAGARPSILTGSVGQSLLWLALPVLGEQVLTMLVGMTDLLLSRFVGAEATVAVGVAGQFGWLVNIVCALIGTGATALVARSWGENHHRRASRFANQALVLAAGLGCAAGLLIQWNARRIPALFGVESSAYAFAATYVRIDGIGHLMTGVLMVGNACMRGAGNTRTPLYVMAMINVCNVIVSVLLVMGVPGVVRPMGVAGIATGTAVARLLGGALVIATFYTGRTAAATADGTARAALTLRAADLRPQRDPIARMLRVGVPAGLDGLTIWAGQLAFVRIINLMATGDEQTHLYAAHIIGIRVESLSYLPAIAWATAAATMVGQCLGARECDRAEHAGHLAARHGAMFCAALGVVYLVGAPWIYHVFSAEPEVARHGVPAMRLVALFQVALALMIIYPGALRGAGDTRVPLLFSLSGMLALRLPLAYVCGHVLNWGLVGTWVGMCADMTWRAAGGAWRFHQGGWKRVRV